jgi:AcrR family transcriptional regulator
MADKNTEKVVAAATQVFRRYGYRRATMGELAEAAGMSRPALYLVFPSKEEIFTAVMARTFSAMLDEVRRGVGRVATPMDKLTAAFEVWCVRPFEMVQASPDAKDLLQSSYEFAEELTTTATADFVAIVAGVLDPLVRAQTRVDLPAVQLARILLSAVLGFKASVKHVAELREMIAGLLAVTLASLRTQGRARRTT